MSAVSRITGAVAALALAAASAGAQGATYTTTGTFTSGAATCNGGSTCSGAGFTLVYTPTSGINVANNSISSIGQFTLTGSGDASAMPGDVMFRIMINQTSPTGGTGNFVGSIFGRVFTTNGNFSSLQFDPNQFVTIGPVQYQAIFDNVGPAKDQGYGIPINNTRGLNVLVTTPEPSSMALLGSGLVGLVPMFRRRRNG